MKPKIAHPSVLLSFLWIALMFLMVFADIYSIIVELENGNTLDIPMQVETAMGLAAVMTAIPISMVVLSAVLPYRTNRWANIFAVVFTGAYVTVGGSSLPHYLVTVGFELTILLFIFIMVLKWRKPEST